MEVNPIYSNKNSISVEYNVEMNTVFDLTKNSVTTYYVGVSIIDCNEPKKPNEVFLNKDCEINL
ncbi:MAG: hypothetical protein WC006_03415 [Bacilli bacterium]